MVSGLMVNSHTSCLIGVNVSPDFMTMACNFLKCMSGTPGEWKFAQVGHLGTFIGEIEV